MRGLDPAVRPLLARQRRALGVAVAATFLDGVLVVAQAFVVGGLVVSVVEHQRVGGWGWAVLSLFVLRALLGWLSDRMTARAAAALCVSLRHDLLAAVLDEMRPLAPRSSEVSRRSIGATVALATRGVVAIEPYLTRFVPSLVLAVTLPPLTVVTIASQDWVSALIVVATLPLIPVFAALVGMTTRDRARRQWRAMEGLAGHFMDVVKGLPTLVAFRRAEPQLASIRRVSDRHRRTSLETLRLAFASSAVLELVATLSVALVAVSVGLRLADGGLSLHTALVVLLLAPEAYLPLRRVGAEFHAAAEGETTLREIAAVVTSSDRPVRSMRATNQVGSPIRIEGLTVTYPGRTRPALVGPSFEIRPGFVVAIAGPSGAGKSTLLAALRGGVPYQGRIAVGTAELTEFTPEEWSAQVAWVPQRPWILDGSLADNVRVAAPDASDESVRDALARVGLGAGRFTDIETRVGEDGTQLSAGERARLALARAVAAKRLLVLLDEPTAHLDPETERVILETIRWLSRRSAVVVVAHRSSVLEIADEVIRLESPDPVRSGDFPDVDASSTKPAKGRPPSSTAAESEGAELSTGSRRLVLGITAGVLASCSGVALTATAGWLIVRASERPPVLMLLVAIIAVRIFGIARPVLRYVERLLAHDSALRALAAARVAVYASLIPLTPGALGRRRGDLLASVVEDVDAQVDRRLRVWSPVATAVAVGAIAAVVGVAILPVSGALLALFALVALSVFFVVQWRCTAIEQDFVSARADVSRQAAQLVEGTEHLAAWSADDLALASVDAAGERLGTAIRRSAGAMAAGRAMITVAVGVAVAAAAVVTSDALAAGDLGAPVAAMLILVPLGLAEVFGLLPAAAAVSARTRQALDRVDELSSRTPTVSETGDGELRVDGAGLAVDLESVAAGWDERVVLDGIDVQVGPGGRLGVTGPSGSGKSTVAALMLRFLDPVAGTVALDGRDVRDLRLDEVRRVVGWVDDDPYLFASTVAENVRLARPSASDDDVEAALVAARLGDWLATLPDGQETFVGDAADGVSGGERARIALARSLLADQPVLVLDEPVAHLDRLTADAVLDDLLSSASGRTVVLIGHGTAGRADLDQVLDLGAHRESAVGSRWPATLP